MRQLTPASAPSPISFSRATAMSFLSSLGLLVIAAGMVIPIAMGGFPASSIYKIVFTAGALMCLLASLFTPVPKSTPVRQKRWKRIESWSSIFFCVAAFFLWYPGSSARDWLAFSLAGAIIRVIVFFISIRSAQKK